MTKYYIDSLGNYVGGFCGEHGVDLSGFTEIPNPPIHAFQKWDFVNNEWKPL